MGSFQSEAGEDGHPSLSLPQSGSESKLSLTLPSVLFFILCTLLFYVPVNSETSSHFLIFTNLWVTVVWHYQQTLRFSNYDKSGHVFIWMSSI